MLIVESWWQVYGCSQCDSLCLKIFIIECCEEIMFFKAQLQAPCSSLFCSLFLSNRIHSYDFKYQLAHLYHYPRSICYLTSHLDVQQTSQTQHFKTDLLTFIFFLLQTCNSSVSHLSKLCHHPVMCPCNKSRHLLNIQVFLTSKRSLNGDNYLIIPKFVLECIESSLLLTPKRSQLPYFISAITIVS